MTPERFIELWRHRFGDAPIPDDKAEHVLLDPPSKNKFSHRDTRSAEAKAECEACKLGHEDTADAADAAAEIPQEFDHGLAICLCGHPRHKHGENGRCACVVMGEPCGCREFEREQDYDDPQGSDDYDRDL